jgi:uncharacterized OB-fold protein
VSSTEPSVYVPKPEGLALELHRRAVETGHLHLQRCEGCGRFRHPPRYRCPECFSAAFAFVPSTERGTVYSFVVSHRSFDPAWVDHVPHVTLAVALDEGPRVIAALRGAAPGAVRIGDPVRIVLEPKGEAFSFLWAEPAEG